MARRKNTKRIDPRYFMNEKTDIIKENRGKYQLESAIYMALRDFRATEQNPTPLSAILDSSDGAVLRYLKEQGLDDRGIKDAMSYARRYAGPDEVAIAVPGGDGGQYVKLKYTTVPVGPSKGEQGMYMASSQGLEEGGYFTTNMPDDIPTTAQLMKKMRGEPDEEPSPFSTTGPDPQAALSTDDLFKLFNAGMNPADLRDVNNSNLTPEIKSILGRPS